MKRLADRIWSLLTESRAATERSIEECAAQLGLGAADAMQIPGALREMLAAMTKVFGQRFRTLDRSRIGLLPSRA